VLSEAIRTLAIAARPFPGKTAEEQDPECRRDAVASLARLGMTAAADVGLLDAGAARCIAETLIVALNDYALDKRGDVGSFPRIAAMTHGTSWYVTMATTPHVPDAVIRAADPLAFIKEALKQLAEKIDRLRFVAGTQLLQLARLDAAGRARLTAGRSDEEMVELAALLDLIASAPVTDWGSAKEVLPVVVPPVLVAMPSFRDALVNGLVVSMGDKVKHVLKPALDATAVAMSQDAATKEAVCVSVAHVVAQEHANPRLSESVFVTVDRLFDKGLLHDAVLEGIADALIAAFKAFTKDIKLLLPLVGPLATLTRCAVPTVRTKTQQYMLACWPRASQRYAAGQAWSSSLRCPCCRAYLRTATRPRTTSLPLTTSRRRSGTTRRRRRCEMHATSCTTCSLCRGQRRQTKRNRQRPAPRTLRSGQPRRTHSTATGGW
jgi:hypothetical protein